MAEVSITRILSQGKHFTPTVVTLEFKIKEVVTHFWCLLWSAEDEVSWA